VFASTPALAARHAADSSSLCVPVPDCRILRRVPYHIFPSQSAALPSTRSRPGIGKVCSFCGRAVFSPSSCFTTVAGGHLCAGFAKAVKQNLSASRCPMAAMRKLWILIHLLKYGRRASVPREGFGTHAG